MNESQQLRESMWDLVYGLLSNEESKALIARIKSDPQAARLYAEVRLQADLVGQAARVDDSSIVLTSEGAEQPAAVSRPKAAAPSYTAAKPATKDAYHRGGAWLAGIAATALAALLAVGFCWPRQNQAELAGKFLVTEVMSQRSLPAGVTGQVALRTARIDSNGEPVEGYPAAIDVRLLDRAGQEQFRKSVQTNEIGLANVDIPGNVLEPGVRLEVAQRTPAAKESDRDQFGRARGWARGSQEPQDAAVTVELPVEPEPQVAYFLVGEPTVEPGKSVPVSVWNFDAFSGKPEPVESLKALESLSEVAQQTTVENSQSGVVNGVVQWKDNVQRQSSALQLSKQTAPSESKPVQTERAASSSQAIVNRRVQSLGYLPPGTGGQQARGRLQQAQQAGRELRDQTNVQRTVAAGQPISVSIPSELAGKPVLAAAICRGVMVATATASGAKSQSAGGYAKKSDGSTLSLDLPPEADGLIEVALFDRSNSEEIPAVREMVYREPLRKLQIEVPDVKSRYAPGEAVHLTLRVSDEQGRAAADTRLGVRVWNENVVEQTGERPVLLADAMRNNTGHAVSVTAGESLSQVSDGFALAGQRQANDEKLEATEGQRAVLTDAEPQAAAPIALPERIELASNRDAVKTAFRTDAAAAEARRQRMLEAIGGAAVFGAVGVLLLIGMLCVLRLATSIRSIAPAILMAGASILIGLSWLGWMPQSAFVHHGQIAMAPAAPAPAPTAPTAASKKETAATNESTAMGIAESSRPAADSAPLPRAPAAEPTAVPALNEPRRAAGRLGDRAESGAARAQPEPGFGARTAGGGLAAADKKEEEKVGVSAGGAPAAATVLNEQMQKTTDPVARALPTLQRGADAPVLELRVESREANQPATLGGIPLSGPAAKQAVTAAPAALYFNADLRTDAAGRATIEFVMPPVESNYRLLVDALGQGRIGSQEQLLTCGGNAAGAK